MAGRRRAGRSRHRLNLHRYCFANCFGRGSSLARKGAQGFSTLYRVVLRTAMEDVPARSAAQVVLLFRSRHAIVTSAGEDPDREGAAEAADFVVSFAGADGRVVPTHDPVVAVAGVSTSPLPPKPGSRSPGLAPAWPGSSIAIAIEATRTPDPAILLRLIPKPSLDDDCVFIDPRTGQGCETCKQTCRDRMLGGRRELPPHARSRT